MSRPRTSFGIKSITGEDFSAVRKASLGSESDDQSPRFYRATAERETRDFNPRPESPLAPKSGFTSWLRKTSQPQAKPIKLTPKIFASVFGENELPAHPSTFKLLTSHFE